MQALLILGHTVTLVLELVRASKILDYEGQLPHLIPLSDHPRH